MNSDEYSSNPDPLQSDDQIEQSPENRIHPDTLKFMGMAKALLDSPAVQQSIEAEQQKDEADSTNLTDQTLAYPSNLDQTYQSEPQPEQSPKLEQPDTLDFKSMARDLLKNSAPQQSIDPN